MQHPLGPHPLMYHALHQKDGYMVTKYYIYNIDFNI